MVNTTATSTSSGSSLMLTSVNGRIATFKKGGGWPHARKKYLVNPETLSAAGFYFRPLQGSNDNVCCFLCKKNLDGWQEKDEAWEEHVKHSLDCPLVRLDVESNRLATFLVEDSSSWPHMGKPSLTAEKLAQAGFFLWPKLIPTRSSQDDTVICFQCGLALDGWEDDDNAHFEHSKRRPECPFIKNGIAIRPFSFEFLLASKPDQTAITHISSKNQSNTGNYNSNNNNEKGKGKFQLPKPPPVNSKRSTRNVRRGTATILQSPPKDHPTTLKKEPVIEESPPLPIPLPEITRIRIPIHSHSNPHSNPAQTLNVNRSEIPPKQPASPSSINPSKQPSPPPRVRIPFGSSASSNNSQSTMVSQNDLTRSLKGIFDQSQLNIPIGILLEQMIDKKLSEFDRRSQELLFHFDTEAKSNNKF